MAELAESRPPIVIQIQLSPEAQAYAPPRVQSTGPTQGLRNEDCLCGCGSVSGSGSGR